MKLIGVVIISGFLSIILLKQLSVRINSQAPVDPLNVPAGYDFDAKIGVFHGNTFTIPPKNLISYLLEQENNDVLGSKSSGKKEKRIEIDLSEQKLYAYSGGKKVHSFLVSAGKWGQTPTGEFRIWAKFEYTLMTGGSKALNTYYYLPNVPYTMYFYNESVPKFKGYGIHGAYWHDNFGHPMSHGCVNMKPEDAKVLFGWASEEKDGDKGTKIVIYGTAPNS